MVRTGRDRSSFDRLLDEMEMNSGGVGEGESGLRHGEGGRTRSLGASRCKFVIPHLLVGPSCSPPSSHRLAGPRERSAGTPRLLTSEAGDGSGCGGRGGTPYDSALGKRGSL